MSWQSSSEAERIDDDDKVEGTGQRSHEFDGLDVAALKLKSGYGSSRLLNGVTAQIDADAERRLERRQQFARGTTEFKDTGALRN